MQRVRWFRVIATTTMIAACVTYVHFSSTDQRAVVFPNAVPYGNVPTGTSAIQAITIGPAFGANSDIVQSIVPSLTGCNDFSLQLPPLPATVESTCIDEGSGVDGSGSGSGGC